MTAIPEREILRPAVHLNSADFVRTLHGHVVPESVDWHDAVEPGYWRVVGERLREGDRIEVITADRQICFEVVVLEVNPRVSPLHMKVGVRPIWPLDLALPVPPKAVHMPYRVRQEAGGLYGVVNAMGDVVKSGLTRSAALDACVGMIDAVASTTAAKAPPAARAAR